MNILYTQTLLVIRIHLFIIIMIFFDPRQRATIDQ